MKKSMLVAIVMIAASAVFAGPQTTCPVMNGSPVSSKLYVDADGYRIYVCCGACLKAVKADPTKFIAKMKAEGVELEKTPMKK